MMLSRFETRIRTYGHTPSIRQSGISCAYPFSFIRTMTVGSGIAPDLLTLTV
jgi:hypothetical protein